MTKRKKKATGISRACVIKGVEFSHPEVEAIAEVQDPSRPYSFPLNTKRTTANDWPLIDTSVVLEESQKPAYISTDQALYEAQVTRLRKQQFCSHRKGDRWLVPSSDTPLWPGSTAGSPSKRPRPIFALPQFTFDFNVSMHTFIDGHQEIKCLTCHRVWKTGDTDFQEALKLVQNSSNRPSSSEMPLGVSDSVFCDYVEGKGPQPAILFPFQKPANGNV